MRRLLILVLAAAAIAPAQINQKPRALDGVGVEEKIGAQVDGSLEFADESGHPVRLASYLNHGRPVILNLAYYACPMLCSRVLNGLTNSIRQINWTPGTEYDILTISFDPKETSELALRKKTAQLASFDRPAPGWHFFADYSDNSKKLAEQVGFHYRWDERKSPFAHTSAIILLTPECKVARYLYGIQY